MSCLVKVAYKQNEERIIGKRGGKKLCFPAVKDEMELLLRTINNSIFMSVCSQTKWTEGYHFDFNVYSL